jgi:two-component system sensor histidine kinase PilS (NtrC family)
VGQLWASFWFWEDGSAKSAIFPCIAAQIKADKRIVSNVILSAPLPAWAALFTGTYDMQAVDADNLIRTPTDLFPLPESLTRRIIGYLGVYRLVIALLLLAGQFALFTSSFFNNLNTALLPAVLLAYLLFAAFQLFMAQSRGNNSHVMARNVLLLDVIFLGLMQFLLASFSNGIPTLLIFTAAMAGMLLPLRMALFVAAIATLSLIGQAVYSSLQGTALQDRIATSAVYGATAMVICLLSHRLAYWARDYRLIAERQEVQISDLEEINETIIRNMSTGILAIDANRRIRIMNEYAWFLLGSPRVRELLLHDLSPRLDRLVERWLTNPNIQIKPVLLETSQANILPTLAFLPGDEKPGALVILNDESVISRRALELSANSLAKLSGSIAHEIRNPLAALTHAAQLLDESPSITLNDMRLTNIIIDQSKRMNGIVENILQLSRQEQSRPEPVELNSFLKALSDEFRSSQGASGLGFDLLIETGKTLVVFDKSQLHQCLWKLLDNTIHHASVKRPPHTLLKMRKDVNAGYCVITVEDNGPGIPNSRIVDIFEPFYTTRKEGSGLGLYVARQLCEANQAELTVDSQPGIGTSFHIRMGLAPQLSQIMMSAAKA